MSSSTSAQDWNQPVNSEWEEALTRDLLAAVRPAPETETEVAEDILVGPIAARSLWVSSFELSRTAIDPDA